MNAETKTVSKRPAYHEWAPAPSDGSLSLSSLVPGTGPVEIDVGFGRGRSLFTRAAAAPTSRLLGIEAKAKWVFKVHQRLTQQNLDRVRVYVGDARDLCRRLESDASVDRVFVHFPDPWWKKRHRKRVVVDAEFVDHAARLLRPGGTLFIQTDVPERAEQYRSLCVGCTSLELGGEDGFVHENPFASVSNRERRAIEDGLPIYRLLATKY